MSDLIRRLQRLNYSIHSNEYKDSAIFEAIYAIQQAHREADESAKDAFRRGWEQAKEESRRTIQQLEATNRALLDQLSKGITLRAAPVMMADAEAHRMGWEQAKGEAVKLMKYIDTDTLTWEEAFDRSLDAIAAMEYKEKANDCD